MMINHLGYEIICEEITSWDGKVKSNHLSVEHPRVRGQERAKLIQMWWPGKMKDGIKEGVKLVDKHVKAMTISPGKG